jgi:AcrR family transcriptional regulator
MIRARSKKPPKAASQLLLRERILNAAFCAFMEKGYSDTSTLEIATLAKVSKRELYQIWPDKAALLKDAIIERAQRMRLPLELPVPNDRDGLVTMLTAFGMAILKGVCDPAVQTVYRLAIEESARAPEVARLLDSVGRGASRSSLARMLARAQARGLIGAGEPAAVTVDFFALLWGDLLLQLLLRVADPPTPRAIESRAREAATKLLRLYPQSGHPRSVKRKRALPRYS